MPKNILHTYIKKTNFNLLIFCIILLIVIGLLSLALITPLHNIRYGPFFISPDEIIELSQNEEFTDRRYFGERVLGFVGLEWLLPQYSRGREFYFSTSPRTGFHAYTVTRGDQWAAGDWWRASGAIPIGDEWLMAYGRGHRSLDGFILRPNNSINTRYAGSQMRRNAAAPSQVINEGDVLKLMADRRGGFVLWTNIGIVARVLLILWLIILTLSLIKRFLNIKGRGHPIFKRVKKIGNTDDFLAEIELGYKEERGKVVRTENWAFERNLFSIDVSKRLKISEDGLAPSFRGMD